MGLNSSHIQRSAIAEQNFRKRLAELGATLQDQYHGAIKSHYVICKNGHDCYVRPNDVQQGDGICRICAGNDSVTAYQNFEKRLTELGATLIDIKWMGSATPHHVKCVNGHDCYPRPNQIQQGKGICKACVGKDPVKAFRYFQDELIKIGATLLETKWLGSATPHHVKCVNGHDCYPRPNLVKRGRGICHKCVHMLWNTFYVVTNPVTGNVKFGITSEKPESRLKDHARIGYKNVHRLITDLPDGIARSIENSCIYVLHVKGFDPVRGREYYEANALPIVLEIADNWVKVRGGK